jgi:uncharacterized protein YcfL
MKTKLIALVPVIAALVVAGCSTYDKGPYLPEQSKTPAYENTENFVLLDPGVKYTITCTGINERTLEDGRIEVTAQIRNRENRRIEVQVNCVFKDGNMVSTGDETPFQTVILTENATESVKFVSANNLAKKYTVRVRQAR